ncbi:glutamine amidotransferase [Bartonella australis AUST/NH1]|uniref:Glutamine amidotransferase n=1 Tax=Bartonella australis (strain Aust/NH1) TaxID=1094489 RepID=M1NV01_BARAA|nr:glutamine amidotransferase [Bartonella australis]AGF75108.1 glutamine amidotransferase [Bartonella australis AUST/NH1]
MFPAEKGFGKEERNSKSRIAVVLHREPARTGWLRRLLQQSGFVLDTYSPMLGQKLPDTLENYAGVVILGGPMSVNDEDAYIRKEIDWISLSLKDNKPFLGVCLGAQMLARNLGGRVGARSDGVVEVGWYPLETTPQGRALIDWPEMVYHFHSEGIHDLPKGAVLLARSQAYPVQAFRYGNNAWGWQFHAEFTRAMIRRLLMDSAQDLTKKGAQPALAHLEGCLIYDWALHKWFEKILRRIFGVSPALSYEG